MRQPSVSNSFPGREQAPHFSRRGWIARAFAAMAGLPLAAGYLHASFMDGGPDEAKEIAQVKALGLKAGLPRFAENHTTHFLGLGDGDAAYCKRALAICESLAKDFLSHFRDRGFNKLSLPPDRMTVITLKDKASYRAFAGENAGATVGGHYDLETNRLVVFDFRDNRADLGTSAERVNLFTLVHEAVHLLSFNTGLLARNRDVPACIAEALATYAELWQVRGKGKMGTPNQPRLRALIDSGNGAAPWIPLDKLLTDDSLFEKEETEQAAYAESWLLANHLLKRASPQLDRFHAYLAKIAEPPRTKTRLQIAEEELGSLDELNREIHRSAQKLIPRRR
jgi:Protein of unknown function (DUF1570)